VSDELRLQIGKDVQELVIKISLILGENSVFVMENGQIGVSGFDGMVEIFMMFVY
jgi:hypothetical protein